MSRSHRKTPIRGIAAADSEASDKAASHRKVRRAVRVAVAKDDPVLPQERELTNPWSMAKDGKAFFNPSACPKLMRK